MTRRVALGCLAVCAAAAFAGAGDPSPLLSELITGKPVYAKRQGDLLAVRYDLADRPAAQARMSGGKPVQAGVRVRLPRGTTWESLARLSPEEIRRGDLWPAGFLPLPHPHHEIGGMVFPSPTIAETRRQTGRDLTRLDLDFDLPLHLLPEFPAPMFLTTRPDLGDVSRGRLVTLDNFDELFHDALNPKQLEGLRLLVTPFPQAQFNATADRRTTRPHAGVACFDCHANGHTTAATHTSGDARPNDARHRIGTPSLRGLYAQRLFGSQRALMTVEDFTEFEQRAAYFDGDPADAARKGVNVLERGSQVQFMAEVQSLLDFPPAPLLDVFGLPRRAAADAGVLRGQRVFFGRGRCVICHPPPYYTDNSSHDLRGERFYAARTLNGMRAGADGPIKTFALRGIRDSPPYLHDDRLLTLDDTVEFFNLVLETHLTAGEKADLVAFLRVL